MLRPLGSRSTNGYFRATHRCKDLVRSREIGNDEQCYEVITTHPPHDRWRRGGAHRPSCRRLQHERQDRDRQSISSATSITSSASSSAADPNADQIAKANDVLTCSTSAYDAAARNPGADHYAELRKCTGDPALTGMLADLKKLAKYQVHSEGYSTNKLVSAKVTNTAPFSVDLTVCVDQSTSATINAQGEKLPDPTDGMRHLLIATVEYYTSEGGFLVQQLHPQDATC